MAGRATGQAHTARAKEGGLPGGRASAVATRGAGASDRAGSPSTWTLRAYRIGRIGLFAIPLLAVVAVLGMRSTQAFSTDPAAYAHFLAHRWSSPMSIALTTATGVLAIISLASLTLLLLHTRVRWLAIAGFVLGTAGAIMMMIEIGAVVVRAQGLAKPILDWRLGQAAITASAHGTTAALLVFGGAALLTLGWMLLGLAILCTYGLNRGDGGLLIVAAPLVFIGGFFLHVLPTMGAFLLGAAGLGILFTAGRIAPQNASANRRGRLPATAPAMSAFARFTDDDLEAFYRDEEASAAQAGYASSSYAEPAPYESVTALESPADADSHVVPETPEPPVVAAPAAGAVIATPVGTSGRARADRGLARWSRGIATAWQVRRSTPAGTPTATSTGTGNGKHATGAAPGRAVGTPSNSAPGLSSSNRNGAPAGHGNAAAGASGPARKSFSFASWSPFRGGDKPRATDASSSPGTNGIAPASAAQASTVNGSFGVGSGRNGPAAKNGKGPAHSSADNPSVTNESAKNSSATSGSTKADAARSQVTQNESARERVGQERVHQERAGQERSGEERFCKERIGERAQEILHVGIGSGDADRPGRPARSGVGRRPGQVGQQAERPGPEQRRQSGKQWHRGR